MNSDRELLELAARAAGIPIYADGWIPDPDEPDRDWNPRENDGDALRLAVKLRLRVETTTDYCVAYAGSVCAQQFSERVTDGNPYAATRRAIVRAAAAIGEQMRVEA